MKGSIIHDCIDKREITIYIPPSCGAWSIHFPLLFVQDGGYLFEDNAELLEQRFAAGTLPEMILAGVKPHNRLDEYTPWPARPLVDYRPEFGGRGEAYIRFLTDRLKPYLESNYYADGSRSQTGIIGASLGGLISFYAGCKRPDVFSRMGLLSASFWYEGMPAFVREQAVRLASGDCRIYMSVGTREGAGKTTAQKDMLQLAQHAAEELEQGGMGRDRLRFDRIEGGTHGPSWFKERFPEAVEWLFGVNEVRDARVREQVLCGTAKQLPDEA